MIRCDNNRVVYAIGWTSVGANVDDSQDGAQIAIAVGTLMAECVLVVRLS